MSYEETESVVRAFFSDKSLSLAETIEGLKSLIEEIKIMIDSLEN